MLDMLRRKIEPSVTKRNDALVTDVVALQVRVTVELLLEAVNIQGRSFTRFLQCGCVRSLINLPLRRPHIFCISTILGHIIFRRRISRPIRMAK